MKYYWYKEIKTGKSLDRTLITELELPQESVKELVTIANIKEAVERSDMSIFNVEDRCSRIELGYTAVTKTKTSMVLSRTFMPCFVKTYKVADTDVETGVSSVFHCINNKNAYETLAWYKNRIARDVHTRFIVNRQNAFRYEDTHNGHEHTVSIQNSESMLYVNNATEYGSLKKNHKIKTYDKNGD